tara:strand:+ start:1947 stop:2501 length:555 start_codon:yes stop_codon:yes gene_type:complete
MFEKEIKKRKIAFEALLDFEDIINQSTNEILNTIKSGNKVLIIGNGGSASDAQHLSAEMVWKFEKIRRALPFISLTDNVSSLTAISNDDSFDNIFSRQIEALGIKNDILLSISTSGESKNVLNGVKLAKKMNIKTISLTGNNKNSSISLLSDLTINFPSSKTSIIQEMNLFYYHYLSKLIDNEF